MADQIKQDFLHAIAVSVLLYGFSTWTMKKSTGRSQKGSKQEWCTMCRANSELSNIQNRCSASKFSSYKPCNKTNKTCMALLEKERWTDKQRSFIDTYLWMCRCWPTRKDILISGLNRYTWYRQEVMNDRHGRRERTRELNAFCAKG